jgi:hypothetical protein
MVLWASGTSIGEHSQRITNVAMLSVFGIVIYGIIWVGSTIYSVELFRNELFCLLFNKLYRGDYMLITAYGYMLSIIKEN